MTSGFPIVPLGEVLRPVSRPESADPEITYRILGAHWYAKGLYIKHIKRGSEIQADKVYRVEHGDFVYNRLFAWKGSFAIATEENHGCYVSNEFPVFTINRDRAEGKYLWRYFSRASAWDEALSLSSGGTPTSRNRLKEEKLLAMKIPLPSLDEQRRIVARIEELASKTEEARGLRRQAAEDAGAIIPSMASKELAWLSERYKPIPLLDLCDFEGGSQPPKSTFRYKPSSDYVRFLQIRDYSSDDYLTYVPASPRNRLVTPKEVLIGRYGASLGKVLRGKEGAYNVAMCKAVPKNDNLDLDFLAAALAYGPFQERLKEISRSAQVGFNKGDLRGVEYSFPPIPEQRRIVVHLEGLHANVDALKRLQAETAAELDAMLPSILDKAFRGSL